MPKGQYDRTKSRKRPPQRDHIITAAASVYARCGFEGATIERIAGEAGVSKALVLRHFGDKQSLIRAVASSTVADNLARIAAIDETPGLTLRKREQRVFTLYQKNRDQWRLIYGTLLVPSFQFALRPVILRYMKTEYQNLLRYLDAFQDPGEETVRAFSQAMLGLRQQYVLDGREKAFRQAQAALFDRFLRPETAH